MGKFYNKFAMVKSTIIFPINFPHKFSTPGPSGFWDQSQANSALYNAFWSVEQTDFKNVIVENIHWALFEDAEVAEVKRPRNPNDKNSIMKSVKN